MEFGIGISKIWIPLHDVISFLRIKVLDFCFGILLPALMQLRRLEVKENYQRGQLGWCLTISRQSLKNTYITVDTFESKKNYKFETLEFWKDSLAYFTVEQQYSNVWTNADAIYLLNKAVKLISSHQQKMLFCSTLRVLCIRQG